MLFQYGGEWMRFKFEEDPEGEPEWGDPDESDNPEDEGDIEEEEF
jgi:hypothetical protein